MSDAATLEAKVSHLKLESAPSATHRFTGADTRNGSLTDTTSLLQCSQTEDSNELVMRQCFSEAFEREVEYLTSLNIPISKERKRQILADILVWAEVTQQHYDSSIRSFVLEPNQHDDSFQRVGKFFRDAKQQRGLQ